MRLSHLIMCLGVPLAQACVDNNGGASSIDEYVASRESFLSIGAAAILDFRVVGQPRIEHREFEGGTAIDFTVYTVTVLGRLANGEVREPPGTGALISIHSRTMDTRSGTFTTVSFDGSRYRAQLRDGVRLLAAVRRSPFYREGWMPVATFRIADHAGTLAESAFGFSAGAPVTTVLSASTYPYPMQLMGDASVVDASATD
jgi:hypothetical protein